MKTCFPFCPHCWAKDVRRTLHRLEIEMAKATEQLTALNAKFDGLQFQFTDFVNDVRQALTAINADTLSPTAQAQLDQLMSKTDALAVQLASADAEVGDADGSDTPVVEEPTEEVPVDETGGDTSRR